MAYSVVYEQFKSFDQLLGVINSRPNGKKMQGCDSSASGSAKFTGTSSYKQACDMLATGYLEVLPKLKKNVAQQNKLNSKFVEEIDRPRPYVGVQGYVPCVPNAIRNLPQSMIAVDRKPMKRKTLHILYSISGSCNMETDWFVKAGTALLSAIDIVEKGGIQTKIDLNFFCARESDEFVFPTITIKNYGERYSLQKISFPLAHPSMFRRIGFKWLETTPDTKMSYKHGYGMPPAYSALEEALNIQDPATYLVTPGWINDNQCSVEEILKKFEVI